MKKLNRKSMKITMKRHRIKTNNSNKLKTALITFDGLSKLKFVLMRIVSE